MNQVTHDFRGDNNFWGHAIHGNTLRGVHPSGLFQRIKDWRQKAVRMSVMVHSPKYPKVGDLVAWSRKNGGEIIAPIIDVDPCGDPRDMYTLQVYVTPSCRKEAA